MRTWSPPGRYFIAGLVIAAMLTVDASSIESFSGGILAGILWLVVAIAWTIRVLARLVAGHIELRVRSLARWLLAPVALGLTLLLSLSDVPFEMRLSLSRDAMDAAAADMVNGGQVDRGWIGLYPIERAELMPGGVRFLVSRAGFVDKLGFAYASQGEPENLDGNDDYIELTDGWWIWIDGF